MPRRRRSVSPSPTRLPPSLRHPPRRLTIHQFLHRLCDQDHHIIWLIGVYGPLHRVRYSLSRRPDVVVVSTLWDCLGLQDIFEQIDLNNVMLYRQPQRHCKKRSEKTSFGKSFWIYQNMFCFGTPRGLPKLSTETCFFLSHEPKLQRKLASPIRDENSQNLHTSK
jgi:hypothetical protein